MSHQISTSGLCINYHRKQTNVPNIRCRGFEIHHASKMRNGTQKRVNCMLRSIARALARVEGTMVFLPKMWFTAERRKNTTATVPSAEKETNGRMMRPNHLRSDISLSGQWYVEVNRKYELFLDVSGFTNAFDTLDKLCQKNVMVCPWREYGEK